MQQKHRKWKIFAIHHSHTDIGFTDRQEKIERHHVAFIKQAIEISEQARSGARPEWAGFRWTCETFWAVERFLACTDRGWHERLARALQSGDLELSGTYLNMTELIDADILSAMTHKAVEYGASLGVTVNSAMTADINGYSWGYAQSLADAGVTNLFSCVHALHGIFPLGQKQTPFWWETQAGDRILVWNGEHYHLGNELGLLPGMLCSYAIRDEFPVSWAFPGGSDVAEKRISRYLDQLEKEGYPYDFVPVMVSGLPVDNGPPSGAIAAWFHKWNEMHGENITIEFTTLNDFFAHVRKQDTKIPVYRGDWPDWWSDGVASTAVSTQLFRDAQRKLRLVKKLDPGHRQVSEEVLREAEKNLMLYAEHTWGYSSSVSEPWHPLVHALGSRKDAYAGQAHRLVCAALDELQSSCGEASLYPGRAMTYKVSNPSDQTVAGIAELSVDYWELHQLEEGLKVIDLADSGSVHCQMHASGNRTMVCIPVRLGPGEEKYYRIVPASPSERTYSTTGSYVRAGTDFIADIREDEGTAAASDRGKVKADSTSLTSPYVRIKWEAGRGIVSWQDLVTGRELIREDRRHDAFTPVYEVSHPQGADNMVTVRSSMGRNRKRMNAERSAGILRRVDIKVADEVFAAVELIYDLPGTGYYCVVLTAYAETPRVDVAVRIHKSSVWEPENVYISLPFGQTGDTLWIEKTGAIFRPRIDQLPGTGTDFYCIQEGIALIGDEYGIAIATPDTPLLQAGPLAHQQRLLMGHAELANDPAHLYSWVLNNFWETNFRSEVGGFYEFRYFVSWGTELDTAERAIAQCHGHNNGLLSMRVNEQLADGIVIAPSRQ